MKKSAGFWIRFASGIIDISVLFSSFILLSWLLIASDKTLVYWKYYFWGISIIFIAIVYKIFIPLFWNKSLGQWICRIEIYFPDNKKRWAKLTTLLKRELLTTLNWVLTVIITLILIYPGLVNVIVKNIVELKTAKQSNLSVFDTIVISIINLIARINGIIFIVNILSILHQNNKNISDRISKTQIVWKNKWIPKLENQSIKVIKANWAQINWEDIN
ncbi:RDD family protein [Mesomycoplasma conjunctivae]|uniref:RDD family protein n=1 Tax=Mesomycoplasma conjunctivae TaxID=45361 RepID=UPI003DA1D892